jgi:hypothetical protein
VAHLASGPAIKPKLEDIVIFSKFLLLFSSVDMSERYALTTETFPPVIAPPNFMTTKTKKGSTMLKPRVHIELTNNIGKILGWVCVLAQYGDSF